MTNSSTLENHLFRWATARAVAIVPALVFSFLLVGGIADLSKSDEIRADELAVVTFIVGGMMKSRSGAT